MNVVAAAGRERRGFRSIKQTKAQRDAATSRIVEAAKVVFSLERGAQTVRHVCQRRGLIGWAWRIDERDRGHHDERRIGR